MKRTSATITRSATDSYTIQEIANGAIVNRQVPALTALNARLRDDYTREIQAGLDRWNRIPERFDIPFRMTLPHAGFHRKIGNFAGQYVSPDGRVLSQGRLGTPVGRLASVGP